MPKIWVDSQLFLPIWTNRARLLCKHISISVSSATVVIELLSRIHFYRRKPIFEPIVKECMWLEFINTCWMVGHILSRKRFFAQISELRSRDLLYQRAPKSNVVDNLKDEVKDIDLPCHTWMYLSRCVSQATLKISRRSIIALKQLTESRSPLMKICISSATNY